MSRVNGVVAGVTAVLEGIEMAIAEGKLARTDVRGYGVGCGLGPVTRGRGW